MRILQLIAGSGGRFYCENCLRDSAFAGTLIKRGHEVALAPLYLPMYSDNPELTRRLPVYFGGINVYLQQRLKLFRRTPRWIDRIFDSRPLLALAARRAGSTSARGLGAMTLSVLSGRQGRQAKEVNRLLDSLSDAAPPDIVHVSTTLLLGVADEVRRRFDIPIVCGMQDEEVWVDALDDPYPDRCWAAIAELAEGVARFIAPSRYYAQRMANKLGIAPERICVIPNGIDARDTAQAPLTFDPPTVGFLSQLSPALGLDRLVDAFLALKRRPGHERLRLALTGGGHSRNEAFARTMRRKVEAAGFARDLSIADAIDRDSRRAFIGSLSLLCVPIPAPVAYGAFMIEAWAAGVPVVEPDQGGIAELIAASGGGTVYDPASPNALIEALHNALTHPDEARRQGARARAFVHEKLTIDAMADTMLSLYRSIARTGAAAP